VDGNPAFSIGCIEKHEKNQVFSCIVSKYVVSLQLNNLLAHYQSVTLLFLGQLYDLDEYL